MNNENQPISRRSDYESITGEQEYFVTPLLRRAIRTALDRHAVHPQGAACLDVGAGEEPLRPDLERRGYAYQSLDITQNRSNSIRYVARLDAPLPAGGPPENHFDLILCTEVLEHVPDWRAAFANMFSLLKPGGIVLITAPFVYMPHEEPHDYWRPTDHTLQHHALGAGFQVLESVRLGNGWDVLGTLVCSTAVCRSRKSFTGYLTAIPLHLLHSLLKAVLKSRLPEKMAELQTRFYLGNAIVLKK
jgi:SAM-dependent methyltransferase